MTVLEYIKMRVRLVPSAEAEDCFAIPSRLAGAPDTRHSEILETDYRETVRRLADQATTWPDSLRPRVIADLVYAHVSVPGTWRLVALACHAFKYVLLPGRGLIMPDLWCIMLGLGVDVSRYLDGDLNTPVNQDRIVAVRDALYELQPPTRSLEPIEAQVQMAACCPQMSVRVVINPRVVVQEHCVTCPCCERPWVIVREARELPRFSYDRRLDEFVFVEPGDWSKTA